MKPILNSLRVYLTDWRNLLTHGVIGIGLVLIAVFLPIPTIARIGIFAAVIVFNVARMSIGKRSRTGQPADAVDVGSEA